MIFPPEAEVVGYRLDLEDMALRRGTGSFPAPILEEIKGERLWRIRMTVLGRNRWADRSMAPKIERLAGDLFTLPFPSLDAKLVAGTAAGTTITAMADIEFGRQELTLSKALSRSDLGTMLEVDGRAVCVAWIEDERVQTYPAVPKPTLPYLLPRPGEFRLRTATGYNPVLTTTGRGLEEFSLDCVESPA